MAIGVLSHGPSLARQCDRGATAIVAQIMLDMFQAFVDRAPDGHLVLRYEERVQIVLEISQQKRADTSRLEQPHVSCFPAGKIDMRVERDARASQDLVHVRAPDFALVAAAQWRRGG